MPQEINPTYIIGLGGTGRLAVQLIKKLMYTYYIRPGLQFPLIKFLVVDTEFLSDTRPSARRGREAGDDFTYEEEMAALASLLRQEERVHLMVRPTETRMAIEAPQELHLDDVIDTEGLRNQLGTILDGAGGVGVVSKIALARQYGTLVKRLEEDIADLFNRTRIQQLLAGQGYSERYALNDASGLRLNTMVICSLGGGTGKGLFIPVAATIRLILRKRYEYALSDQATLQLYNFLPSCFETSGRKVTEGTLHYIRTNQYAAYKELDHLLDPDVGYVPERFICEAFRIADPQKEAIRNLYSCVFNLSPKQGDRGSVGRYGIVNSILANYVAMSVFGGQQNVIATDLSSNLPTEIHTNPYQEARTGLSRNRCYAMLGYFCLKYPVERLFAWAELFCTRRLLYDMVDGNLRSGRGAEKPGHAKELGEGHAQDVLEKARQLFRGVNPVQMGQTGCRAPDDPWTEKIGTLLSDTLRKMNSNLELTERSALRFAPEEERGNRNLITQTLLDLQKTCTGFVKDFGMQYCRTYLQEYLDEIYESLGTQEWNPFLGSQEPGEAGLERKSVVTRLWGALNESRRERHRALEEWGDPSRCPHYGAIRAKLVACREMVEKEDGFVRKLWRRATFSEQVPELDSATEGEILRTFGLFNTALTTHQDLLSRTVFVGFLKELEEKVKDFLGNLEANISLILGRDGVGRRDTGTSLAEDLAQEMRRVQMKVEETPCARVHGADKAQFESFANRDLLSRIDIYGMAHKALNGEGDVVERLLTERFDKDTLRKRVAIETRKIHEVKAHFSITGYFQDLAARGNPESLARMNQLFAELEKNAEFLGVLDTSVVRGGHPIHMEKKFLYLPEPGKIAHLVEHAIMRDAHITPPVDSGMIALEQRNQEEIILSKTRVGIGLFLFNELRQCADKYLQGMVEGRLGASHIDKDAFLARYHTGKRYFDIPEPFGTAVRITDAEKNTFFNLLFHTGTLRLGTGDRVACITTGSSDYGRPSDYKVLEDPTIPSGQDPQVTFSVLEQDLNDMPEVSTHLIALLIQRLLELGKVEPRHLSWYLFNERYPLMPRFIFRELDKEAGDRTGLRGLLRPEMAERYFRAYDRRLEESGKIEICTTPEKLQRYFAAPSFEIFSAAERLPRCWNQDCGLFDVPQPERTLLCITCGKHTYVGEKPAWQVLSMADPLAKSPPAGPRSVTGTFQTCPDPGCGNSGKDLGLARFCPECGRATVSSGAGPGTSTCRDAGCAKCGQDLADARFCPVCGQGTVPRP